MPAPTFSRHAAFEHLVAASTCDVCKQGRRCRLLRDDCHTWGGHACATGYLPVAGVAIGGRRLPHHQGVAAALGNRAREESPGGRPPGRETMSAAMIRWRNNGLNVVDVGGGECQPVFSYCNSDVWVKTQIAPCTCALG